MAPRRKRKTKEEIEMDEALEALEESLMRNEQRERWEVENFGTVLDPRERLPPPQFRPGLLHSKTKKCLSMLNEDQLRNKIVLVRSDLSEVRFEKTLHTNRNLREAMSTIAYLLAMRAKIILATHMGKPCYSSEHSEDFHNSLLPSLRHYGKVLRVEGFSFSKEYVQNTLGGGEILLMDNLSTCKDEWENGERFSRWLASLADIYVSDSFSTFELPNCASAALVPQLLPSVIGFASQREVRMLVDHVHEGYKLWGKNTFAAIIGGQALEDLVFHLAMKLLENIGVLILCGEMASRFHKFNNPTAALLNNPERNNYIQLLDSATANHVKVLPHTDLVVRQNNYIKTVKASSMGRESRFVDIGPESCLNFRQVLMECATVLWFGATGSYVMEGDAMTYLSPESEKLVKALSNKETVMVVGKEATETVKFLNLANSMSYVSTGGVDLLLGRTPPGLESLSDASSSSDVGAAVKQAEGFGAVENVKETSHVNSPVSGKLAEINEERCSSPGLQGLTAIGLKTDGGVVLAVGKRVTSPLPDPNSVEKIMKIDDHIGCAMSGLIADVRKLVEQARVETQNHRLSYGVPMTVESTTQVLCDQALQVGEGAEVSMSPQFGPSLLIAGHDKQGTSLYYVDPSGQCLQCNAKAIGSGSDDADISLQELYRKDLTLKEAETIAVSVLKQVIGDKVTPNNVDMANVSPTYRLYTPSEVEEVINRL